MFNRALFEALRLLKHSYLFKRTYKTTLKTMGDQPYIMRAKVSVADAYELTQMLILLNILLQLREYNDDRLKTKLGERR